MISMWRVLLVFQGFLWRSFAFPVGSLTVDQQTLHQLNSSAPSSREATATGLVVKALQDIFKQSGNAIEVKAGDIVIQAAFPDTQVDDDCHHKIEAEHPKAVGTIEKSSFLRFGVANVSWRGASVFVDAELDAKLDINTDVCVRVGEKIFHHCTQIARKTVGIDVVSEGKTGVGVDMTASNARLARVNGTWSLVFDFHAAVVGKVLMWHVEQVTADNCKIKILGITIASVCGTIERHVKDKVQTLTDRVMTVTAPKLLQKLEDKINTKIGSQVVIPLKILRSAMGSAAADALNVWV